MEPYFLLDVATVMKLLAVGNAWLVVAVLMHRWKDRNAAPLRYFTIGKSFQAIAWLLISLRGTIPLEISAYVGNPLLYLGFSIDIMAFSRLVGASIKFERLLWAVVSIGSALLLSITDTPTRLIVVSGCTVTLIYLIGGCAMLSTPHRSWLQIFTGLTFFSIIPPMVGRVILAEIGNLSLLSGNNLYNSATFMVQTSMYIISSAAYVLLMKEKDDSLLTQSERREQERATLQKHFMDMLTHELRAALAVIQVSSGSIKQLTSSDQRDIRERLSTITLSVGAVAGILDRCMMLDRTEADDALNISRTSLEELITHSKHFLASPARFELTTGLDSDVLADSELLGLMIDNLLDNALKYAVPESVITLVVRSMLVADKAYTCLTIDNEVVAGSTPPDEKLFTRYSRGAHAHGITGSGLGLYLIKKMANLQSGDATKFNSPATRFSIGFWLPSAAS